MAKFTVVVLERVSTYRQKEIEAVSEEEARELAEADDWSTWETTYTDGDCAIEEVTKR